MLCRSNPLACETVLSNLPEPLKGIALRNWQDIKCQGIEAKIYFLGSYLPINPGMCAVVFNVRLDIIKHSFFKLTKDGCLREKTTLTKNGYRYYSSTLACPMRYKELQVDCDIVAETRWRKNRIQRLINRIDRQKIAGNK